MPTYCDKCENVIEDPEQAVTYCLDCAPSPNAAITTYEIEAMPDLLHQLKEARQYVAKVAADHAGESMGTFASRRLDRMDAAIAKAASLERALSPKPWFEETMKNNGYKEVSTGGGCTGWEKEFSHRNPEPPTDTILITDGNQGHELEPLVDVLVLEGPCWYAGVSEEPRCECHINCVAWFGDEASRADRIQFLCYEMPDTVTFVDCADLSMDKVLSRFLKFVESMVLIHRNNEWSRC
mgnify:FL=1